MLSYSWVMRVTAGHTKGQYLRSTGNRWGPCVLPTTAVYEADQFYSKDAARRWLSEEGSGWMAEPIHMCREVSPWKEVEE